MEKEDYYQKNAEQYIKATKDCDMSAVRSYFLSYVPLKGRILDLGFGSGRDSLAFMKLGYEVYSLDPCQAFIDNGRKIGLQHLLYKKAEDISDVSFYDGIFASASLLHVKREDLKSVFVILNRALKDKGVIYVGFKEGSFAGRRDGRYYDDLDANLLIGILKGTGLYVADSYTSLSVKKDAKESFLNAILKKEGF